MNTAGGKAILAKVFIGIPAVDLSPVDGCTRYLKGLRLQLPPNKQQYIGANLVKEAGHTSSLKNHAVLEWSAGDVCT